jgi:glycosyltransferase 2 family protein
MKLTLKDIIKYTVSFGIGIFLMWYVFKEQDIQQLWNDILHAKPGLILLSISVALLSHIARALRWNMLLRTSNNDPGLIHSFIAVMIGYLANLVLPRMGEVSRCVVLTRNKSIPFNTSFGTVIAERAFDFLTLLALIGFVFLVEFNRLSNLLGETLGRFTDKFSGNLIWVAVCGVLLFAGFGFVFYKFFYSKVQTSTFFVKIKAFVLGVWDGLLSVKKLKNIPLFLFYTVLIWTCYFLMTYLLFFALPDTTSLTVMAGLSVLVMGGLGMAAPVPGGLGTYHLAVMPVLIIYGLTENQAILFATIAHSLQTIFLIIAGLICLFVSLLYGKKIK